MALKHGDRQDLVGPFASWMLEALPTTPSTEDVFLPVPIHWRRMLKRKFNQSALLAKAMARLSGANFIPDALLRLRHTPPQEGMTLIERFELQAGTIVPHHSRSKRLKDRKVIIVDDVMTSGATLAAAATAVHAAGARCVNTVTLTRVVKEI